MTGGYLHSASEWIVADIPEPPVSDARTHCRISDDEMRRLYLRACAGELVVDLAKSVWRGRYTNAEGAADAIRKRFERLGFDPVPKRARRRSIHARKTPRRKMAL